MPTIITHAAVPLALRIGLGKNAISTRLTLLGVAYSMLPDLDVIAFHLGIPYAHELGHRGFSHSLLAALLLALLGASLSRWLHTRFVTALLFLFVAAASHPLLDALTNGGLGVALFWPWSDERFFFPIRVIEVSPLTLERLLSPRGLAVASSELYWVWLPCSIAAIALIAVRIASHLFRQRSSPSN